MILLIIWYGVLSVLAGWVLITQIITPLRRKTKLFPMFLAEEKLYSQLTETMQKGGFVRFTLNAILAVIGILVAIQNGVYKTTQKDVKQQQQITMDVQTSIADAKKAEQYAITVAKQGEANAAKAKWEQEVIKAKAVTQAEQQKEVAKLDKEAAEFTKQKLILEGEGEAAKKKAIMSADGALDRKLSAWMEVNAKYAEAIKGAHLVPSVVMGDGGKISSANDWIQLFMAKTAKDLALDMTVQSK
jgi:hypothetical protein